MISDCVGVYFRYLDDFGDPVMLPAPKDCVLQIGFDEDDALFPNDNRIFRGFDFLREYFMFPRKFLGFKLTRLAEVMPKLKAKSVDILFTFDEVTTRLAAAVQPEMFALYAAPAVNLFEKTTDRIPIKSNLHEYQWSRTAAGISISSRIAFLNVFAHYPGGQDKVPVRPLYSASMDRAAAAHDDLFYTVRRLPRRRSSEERRFGSSSDYTGTDMFISLRRSAAQSTATARPPN